MKKEKKINCLHCKYWNPSGGCFLYFLKEQEKMKAEMKHSACNDTSESKIFVMPPKAPQEDISGKDVSTFYKKDGKCKWYKFNLIDAIFNRLH